MLTPERRAQMDAVLGNTRTPKLSPQRRAQMDAILKQPTPKAPSIQGFGENIVKSGVKAIGDIASAGANVFNPVKEQNTIYNVGKLATGVMNKTPYGATINAVKDFTGLTSPEERQFRNESNEALVNTGKYYGNRYGVNKALQGDFQSAIGQVGNTLYNDPVGVAMDVSTVAGAGGVLAGGTKAGKVLNTVAKVTDPVSMGARGTGKVFSKTFGKAPKIAGEFSDLLAEKQIRANPSQIAKFEETTGKPLSKFVKDRNYFGGARTASEKVAGDIGESQKLYNAMARTDSPIPREMYAEAIRAKAQEILSKTEEPSARAVADKLMKEADYIQAQTTPLTDTILTNTKSGSYGRAGLNAISDPITENFNKALAEAGNSVLENINPEVINVGRNLRDLRQFEKIVKKQRNLGTGSQLINAFKAPVSTAGLGAVAGSFIPGVGNLAGAGLGLTGAMVLNSPKFQSAISKLLDTSSKAKLPKKVSVFGKNLDLGNTAKRGYTFSKFASRVKEEE